MDLMNKNHYMPNDSGPSESCIGVPDNDKENTVSKDGNMPMNSLSKEQVSEKMRNIFQSGLAIHLKGEEMEACKAVATSLFPHQRVALAWMFEHENNRNYGLRGGILADDMGLGKSLTVIALIMTNHWDRRPLCKPELGFKRSSLKCAVGGGKRNINQVTSAALDGV